MPAQLKAVFPVSQSEIAVVFPRQVVDDLADPSLYRLRSGLTIRRARPLPDRRDAILLETARVEAAPLLVDQLRVKRSSRFGSMASQSFIHSIQTPMELKVPRLADRFPFRSDLVGLHVSVMCCTGCNGGIHPRGLVVLNSHSGGPWSSIWVHTAKTIDGPYPRWQRVLFAGGVITERGGSMAVSDRGWMMVRKSDEEPHHAPPPLPIETVDVPARRTRSLLAKSLDAVWVELRDVVVESVRAQGREGAGSRANLPRIEALLSDRSGGQSMAWLYHKSGQSLRPGQRVRLIRGFVHAEAPGRYVILSDKDEDFVL